MKRTRPALAYRLERTTDEPATLKYDEARQISLLSDGTPAVRLPGTRIQTFAKRDRPEPSTNTKAARDPGDLDALAWLLHDLAAVATATRAGRDKDDDQPHPRESFARRSGHRGRRLLTPDIVAVTTRTDVSADMVVQCCATRGVEIYRFNSEDYPQHIGLELDPVHPEGAQLRLTDDRSIAIGRARGIWLRRPQWPVVAAGVTDPLDRQLAVRESVAAAGGLWRLLEHRCVSSADALQAARWKLPQLHLAARLGFNVPETIVTTNLAAAQRFAAAGPTVIKAVQDAYVRVGTTLMNGVTERARPDALDGVELAPVMLQREVAKVADYRVTVVGRQVFAGKITTPVGSPLDVRATDPAECEITEIGLPTPVHDACLAFVEAADLRFAAFDLAETADGAMWFFECNANGQWGWIELATGAPMTNALVELLISGRSRDYAREDRELLDLLGPDVTPRVRRRDRAEPGAY